MSDVKARRVEIVEILEKAGVLVDLLDNFSRSQVALWQEVRDLGKKLSLLHSNTSGLYNMVRLRDVWPISPAFIYGLNVNLKTGALGPMHLIEGVTLGELPILLDQIDAEMVIKSLQNEVEAYRMHSPFV